MTTTPGQYRSDQPPSHDGFVTTLSCESLGIDVTFDVAVEFAAEFRFDAVEPDLAQLDKLDEEARTTVSARLAERGLRWGWATLPVALHADQPTFERQLAEFDRHIDTLRAATVDRIGTWIRPMSDTLCYRDNFDRHVERIKQVSEIVAAADLRLGLEYVGVRTLWSSERFPFVHSLAGLLDLVSAVGSDAVGFVLDSYHWYTAGESASDLRMLRADQVIGVDLNDATPGVDRDEQLDQVRELPGATGVIDVRQFLDVLRDIGYCGPLRVEPFGVTSARGSAREAVARAATALHTVLS